MRESKKVSIYGMDEMQVTPYATLRWVLAAIQIVIGVILLIVGYQMLANTLSPVQPHIPITTAFLLGVLLFAAIACFILAAANIGRGFVSKPGRMSLASLDKRIDMLEVKLMTSPEVLGRGAAEGLSATPAAIASMPPEPEEATEIPSKKIALLVIGVAAVLIIAAFAFGLGLTGPGTGGGATPEQTLNNFLDAFNAGDADRAVDMTVFRFADNRSDIVQELEQFFASMGQFHISVDEMNIIYGDGMNASERESFEELIEGIEAELGLNVTDYCMATISVTMTVDGDTQNETIEIPCVKVDGAWYIAVIPGGPEGDNGYEEEIYIEMLMYDGVSNWTFAVSAISGPGEILIGDVYVTVRLSNGSVMIENMDLSSVIPGDNYSGVVYNDFINPDYLNVGDTFVLEKSIYDVDSSIMLADEFGDNVYCEYWTV